MDLTKAMGSLPLLCRDERIKVWHISAYMAIIQLWHQGNCRNPIFVTRGRIMKLARIRSIATYHKYLKELEQFGYIKYIPSYHPGLGSQVFLELAGSMIVA
jgi:hypothetical protein